VKRLTGKEKPTYAHGFRLSRILRDTLGVCIYQEQVMQIAQTVGDMSLAEADLVRRSKVKYSGRADRERLSSKFEKSRGDDGDDKRGTPGSMDHGGEIGRFWILQSACGNVCGYFVSHGVSEDASQPAEFLAAMCSAGAGFISRFGVCGGSENAGESEVRLPSVNRSRMEYTGGEKRTRPNSIAGPAPTKAMRIGLMQVKGFASGNDCWRLCGRGEAERAFRSLEDFLARVPVELDEIEGADPVRARLMMCAT